jgi:DNA excision repair protein ERCC-6
MCKTPQQTAEFKHMLDEIASLEKGGNSRMRGKWVLKEEFK